MHVCRMAPNIWIMYEQKYIYDILKCICRITISNSPHRMCCTVRKTHQSNWYRCVCMLCFLFYLAMYISLQKKYFVFILSWLYYLCLQCICLEFLFLLSAFICKPKNTKEGKVIEFNNVDYFVILFSFWLAELFSIVCHYSIIVYT